MDAERQAEYAKETKQRCPIRVGALVLTVVKDGPAEKAGVLPLDVVLAVGKKPVRNADALLEAFGASQPGETVILEVRRHEEKLKAKQPGVAYQGGTWVHNPRDPRRKEIVWKGVKCDVTVGSQAAHGKAIAPGQAANAVRGGIDGNGYSRADIAEREASRPGGLGLSRRGSAVREPSAAQAGDSEKSTGEVEGGNAAAKSRPAPSDSTIADAYWGLQGVSMDAEVQKAYTAKLGGPAGSTSASRSRPSLRKDRPRKPASSPAT